MSDAPPAGPRPFLTAQWRWLLLLHHEVPASLLAPRLPRGVELDPWNGRHLVGLVAFRFVDTRLLGVAVPFHRHFDEVNLRFHVRRREGGRWRRGVVFLRELVPRRAVAAVARLAHGEPYSTCRVRSAVVDPRERPDARGEVEYAWSGRHGSGRLRASLAGAPFPLEPGTLDEFVAEHRFGYSRRHRGQVVEYEVERPPWRAWTASTHASRGDWERLHGPGFAEALSSPAVSELVAEGSEVVVRRPRPLPG